MNKTLYKPLWNSKISQSSSIRRFPYSNMSSVLSFVTLALYVAQTSAAVGPVTDLRIANGVISPDGFARK
jgi:hypothetical protein